MLRVTSIAIRVEREDDRIEHVIEIYTHAIARRRARRPVVGLNVASNVVRMPTGDNSVVAEFLLSRAHPRLRRRPRRVARAAAPAGGPVDDGGGTSAS
jgi:hypothetical protein